MLARALAAVLALATLALAGCTTSTRRDPSTLVVLERGDGDTLNPLFSTNAYASLYQSLLFDGLTMVGDNFTDAADLATSWKGTPDGLHWTVELRRGVEWSDGAPFTSKDVTFTWNAMLDPKTTFPYRGQFLYVKSVTALGRYRVRFDLSSRNSLFISQGLGASILPEHVLGKVPHAQLRSTNFGEQPVGTGPYKLQEWRHDVDAAFVTNPRWWGGAESVRRIVFQIALNDQSGAEAMEQGNADVDDAVVPSIFSSLQASHANLRFMRVPDLYFDMVEVNNTKPGLDDVTVRRAMMYGWDRSALAKGYFHGDEQVATSITPVGLRRWYDPHVREYPYDPARARAMLDAAGYKPGPDGVRRRGKTRLDYAMILTGNTGAQQDLGADFQADMRAIGIATTIRTIDFATAIDLLSHGEYDLMPIAWGGVDDPDEQTLLACDQVFPNGNNDMRYCNRRLTRDLQLGIETIDYAKRRAIYDEVQRIVADDVPVLYYGYRYYEDAISPRVHFDAGKALPDYYFFRDVMHWKLGPL